MSGKRVDVITPPYVKKEGRQDQGVDEMLEMDR